MQVKTFFKEKTFISESKRNFIRSLPCNDCGWPPRSECHHIRTGGASIKCGDDETVPLCSPIPFGRGCHTKADKSPESVEKYKEAAERYHQRWLAARKKKDR